MSRSQGRGLFRNHMGRDSLRTRLVVLVFVLFAASGYVLLQRSDAATSDTTSAEAEKGLTGPAVNSQNSAASGGGAVRFGTAAPPPMTPTNLRAFTGGNNIALTWNPKSYNSSLVKTYNVYRDSIKIATTAPDENAGGTLNGSQYIDNNVVAGRTYSYQVQTAAGTNLSTLSAGVQATHPTSTTPVPNVVLDPSLKQHIPSLDSWFQTHGVPTIKTWYPKVADRYARPDYVPQATITVKTFDQATFNRNYPGAAAAAIGSTMVLNPEFYTSNRAHGASTLVHESTHILQYYRNGVFDGPTPRWFVEGMASFSQYDMYNNAPYDNDPLSSYSQPVYYYTDGYLPAASFIRWIMQRYDPNYMRQANIASNKGTYDNRFVQFNDGRNIDQAWGSFSNTTTRTGTFKSVASGKCLDDTQAKMDRGTLMILWPCNGNIAQKITYRQKYNSTAAHLIVVGHCLEAANNATANRTVVWINYCDAQSTGQEWIKRTDGTIVNPASGRCLEVDAGNVSSPDGAPITIWDCNGGNWQKWTTP